MEFCLSEFYHLLRCKNLKNSGEIFKVPHLWTQKYTPTIPPPTMHTTFFYCVLLFRMQGSSKVPGWVPGLHLYHHTGIRVIKKQNKEGKFYVLNALKAEKAIWTFTSQTLTNMWRNFMAQTLRTLDNKFCFFSRKWTSKYFYSIWTAFA